MEDMSGTRRVHGNVTNAQNNFVGGINYNLKVNGIQFYSTYFL